MTALECLKQYFGYETFRDGQEVLINDILAGKDVLGIMPTGAGKSICFQIPALMMNGIALIISPLISLMKDQVNALVQSGAAAAYINSSLSEQQTWKALSNAAKGTYKLIYVAPERLLSREFLSFAQSADISILTVDEAHCISQWGQDFRPSYSMIPEFVSKLKKRPPISAFTATATAMVREDIVNLLGLEAPTILTTGFNRENLYFEVQKPKNKFSALLAFLEKKKDLSGIVYCSTRATVEDVCLGLKQGGYGALRYHAGLSDSERRENQDHFLYDRMQIMVATNAFGMGIDKSNVSYVVHYNMPMSVESYYQEAGRAGRDGEPAECVLLYGGKDVHTNQWLIDNASDVEYPDEETKEMCLKRNHARLRDMTFYCATKDCLRRYILRYFGEKSPNYCGNCGSCNTNFENVDITVDAQKIISCVVRLKGHFGIGMVVDVLRGSKNERILSLGLDKLSTYGISEKAERQLREIIDHLILSGYLLKTDGEYPVIRVGQRADEVLRGGGRVYMKLAKEAPLEINARKEKKHAALRPVDKQLLALLKEVRLAIANERNVPAFTVFHDSSLIDMCMKLPTSDDEFLAVSGVGKVKMEQYGKRFVNVISGFIENNGQNAADNQVHPASQASQPSQPSQSSLAQQSSQSQQVSQSSQTQQATQASLAQQAQQAQQATQASLAQQTTQTSHTSQSLQAPQASLATQDLQPQEFDPTAVEISESPVTVSVIADRINCVLMTISHHRVTGRQINDWLVSEGFCAVINENGTNYKMPTDAGSELGIKNEERVIRGESVRINMFGIGAQKHIVQNAMNVVQANIIKAAQAAKLKKSKRKH